MLRGMRWGELVQPRRWTHHVRSAASETRTSLKRLLMEGNYAEAIEIAETAMATPAGRAWLDLQRYVVTWSRAWLHGDRGSDQSGTGSPVEVLSGPDDFVADGRHALCE